MTNNFEIVAAEKVELIAEAILSTLQKGSHKTKAINAVLLSERSGVKNIGKVLRREAVSLRTVLRIFEALKDVAKERGIDISETTNKIIKIIA